jgi:hypothetical protein
MTDETPKIHVDADWKAQAQAEKERLAEKEREQQENAAAEGAGGPEGRGLPEANFKALMGTLASQALMGLGTMRDPKSGHVVVDLEGSQFAIDLLQVLEDATKGNITEEDASEMTLVLAELRARFVQLTQMVAEQQATMGAQVQGGAPGATPGAAAPGIITPG